MGVAAIVTGCRSYAARVPVDTRTALDIAVAADDLVLAFGDHVAIQSATFTLPRGRVSAIIGPNGSGKTTLLRAISGTLEPRSGSLEVLGQPAVRRARDVAHVMQATKVNETMPLTVAEVVRMGRFPARGALARLQESDHEAVAEALERMDIADLARVQLRDLSGGQQQRVFVAQGLAQQAELLLLDEPITGLDLTSQQRIEQALADETAAGHTVIATTHDVRAAGRADHVLLLATHVVASGPPDDVLTEEHLGHAYGGPAFRTPDGSLVITDPHVHGTQITGHEDHA